MKKNTLGGFRKIENQPKVTKRDVSDLESLLHSEHTVTIEKLVVGGDGLTRINFKDKKLVVFVPFSAPQDQVKIKITEIEKNHLIGSIVDMIVPSPNRQIAPCNYFGECGGCNWQHIQYTEQLKQKEKILVDLFKKFLPDMTYKLEDTVSSPKQLGYRNRIQLKQLQKNLGYFKKSSHEIVDIEHCQLAEAKISEQIKSLKENLKPSEEVKKFELKINLKNDFEFYPIGKSGEDLSFAQVNNELNQLLLKQTINLIEQIQPKFLSELYAGAGNFTLPILEKLKDVVLESAEMNSALTTFANQKRQELNLEKRWQVFTSDCESFVKQRDLSKELVLLDPPRSGCSDDVTSALNKLAPQNIIYISCHPAHLVRDLKNILSVNKNYKISYLQIFDMFPQTDHFETLVWLSK